ITPIDQAYQFVSLSLGDAIMDFVNEMGYPEFIHFMSRMAVNNLYQPWRAILSMINQSIQTFLTDKANLGSPTKRGRKDKPHVIPYCRFTKLIICHLGRIHNIHQRSTSPFHLAEEDLRLGNLKFVPKGEEDEHDQKVAAEKEGKKKTVSTKQPKSKSTTEKSSKPALASKPKPAKEKPSKPSTAKPPKPKPAKDTPQQKAAQSEPEPEPEQEGKEPAAEATRPLLVVEGKGKAIATEEQAAQSLLDLHTPKRRSTTDQFILQRRTPATEEASTGPSAQPQDDASTNIVCESPSPVDAETGADTDKTNSGGDTKILQISEEQGDDVANLVNLEEKTAEIDEGQAGSDPGKTPESRPPPDDDKMDEDLAGPDPRESRVALAGPNHETTHDEFMANVYPNVHESLKFPADEHVILEDLLSSTGTLSSMKNLDDAFTIGDQFINDKSTKDEPEKLNVEAKVVSMVTVLIYQASSSVPPLSTPVIDFLSPSKPQSTTELELAARVAALEQKFSGLEQKSKTLNNTTQNLGSRVFTLELRDLPHKINQTVNEVVKEAVHVALQAPLRDRFKELPEADMKEILHQHMFEAGTYKSLPEHVALYGALEASMERANRDEFFAEKDKSSKHQLLSPILPTKTDTREAPSRSSKKQFGPHSEQPVEDVPMPDTANISDSEDTDSAYLPKIKSRPEWLKHILEEDGPTTPEPDWSIPMNDLPEPENN
ncbi:hypothetical protein Tco_0573044, partial [Tanacetum coccineum]